MKRCVGGHVVGHHGSRCQADALGTVSGAWADLLVPRPLPFY